MVDFKALGAKAAAAGTDMTKPTAGGGDYTPPAAGPCRLRFIGYVEIGKHEKKYKGVPKVKPRVMLIFEVSGPNHPVTVTDDGKKIPIRITVTEGWSLNEKANFFKLFQRMNYKGQAQHMAQLLGEGYKGTIVHRKYRKEGDPAETEKWTGVAVELRNKDGYTIMPPTYEVTDENGPTGVFKDLAIDPAIGPLRCFIWDHADMEQWNSLYIEGKYEDRKTKDGSTIPGKSKNVLQAAVMSAKNFADSPMALLLKNNGQPLVLPDVDSPTGDDEVDDDAPGPEASAGNPPFDPRPVPTGEAATDALAGIVG